MVRLRRFSGTLWTLISLGLALVAAGLLLVVPSGTVTSTTATLAEDGVTTLIETTTRHITLLQNEGWSVLVPLLVPVALALIALMAARRAVTITCAALALAFTVLSVFSIGVYFLPAAVALFLAALRSRSATLVT